MKIRELILSHRVLQVIVVVVGLGIMLWYVNMFTMVGIKYEGTFLKRVETQKGFNYEGKHDEGNILVSVSNVKSHNSETLVEFSLPNSLHESFTTQYVRNNTQFDVKALKDESKTLLFKGTYIPEGSILLMNDQDIYIETPQLTLNNEKIFNENYSVPLCSVLDFATDQSTIRGVFDLFIIGLILTVGGVLEYLYPMFFFKLRYRFTVEDPEPTDFYMVCQRSGVILSLVLGPLLLLAALYN